jgi:hypothetical protein
VSDLPKNNMVFVKILFFIVLFLLFGAFLIISNENIRLNNKESINYFLSQYNRWLNKQVDNSSKLIGYVIHDIFPQK